MTRAILAKLGLVAAVGLLVPLVAASCKLVNPPRIMVLMMENQGLDQIVGNSAMPYTNSLATDYGLATESYACTHSSLPNYIDVVSGECPSSALDDGPPSEHTYDYTTVADQLLAAGDTVKAYAEDLPADPGNDSGNYVVHHVPWEYFPNTPVTVEDASSLMGDLNSATPPDFVFYTPNVLDDGDGEATEAESLAGEESFLSTFIPQVQSTAWYQGGGQIIIEWDEALTSDSSGINGGSGGHIPTIVVSKYMAARPQQYTGQVDTAGILNSIEHIYQLPLLGGANDPANGNIDPLLEW